MIEVLRDFKLIKKNVGNMLEEFLHNEEIPLLIRADVLIESGVGRIEHTNEPYSYSIQDLLEDMSKANDEELENMYKTLDYMVNNEIVYML